MNIPNEGLSTFFQVLAWVVGISLVVAILLLGWVLWRVRHIQLPQNADFFTTLRHTPLSVVILLDVLDLSLDFLSAPVAWVILDRLGLKPLRAVSVVETLIPGTQFIPTMTALWFVARFTRIQSPF